MKIEEYFFPDDLYYHKEHFGPKSDTVTMERPILPRNCRSGRLIELPSVGRW
jgi:hypothetical protein